MEATIITGNHEVNGGAAQNLADIQKGGDIYVSDSGYLHLQTWTNSTGNAQGLDIELDNDLYLGRTVGGNALKVAAYSGNITINGNINLLHDSSIAKEAHQNRGNKVIINGNICGNGFDLNLNENWDATEFNGNIDVENLNFSGASSIQINGESNTVGNLTQTWGLDLNVSTLLEVTGTLAMSSGSEDSISGSGTIRANKLDLRNWGKYVIDVNRLEIGEGGIVSSSDNGIAVRMGATTIASDHSWNYNKSIALIDATTGTTFEVGKGKTIGLSGILSDYVVTTGEGDAAETTTQIGKLIKTGDGELKLSGANTYSGGTTIKKGMLTVSGAGTLGAGPVAIEQSGTLKIDGDNATTNASMLLGATGEGNIIITKDTTFEKNANAISQVKGNLTVQGAILNANVTDNVNNSNACTADLSSFTSWTLDNATVIYHGKGDFVMNNVTVESGSSELQVYDMHNGKTIFLNGLTTLDGNLAINTTDWKSTTNIAKLTGAGNISLVSGNAYWAGASDPAILNIEGMTQYQGDITVTQRSGKDTPAILNLSGILDAGTAENATSIGGTGTINVTNATTSGNIEFTSDVNVGGTITNSGALTFNGDLVFLTAANYKLHDDTNATVSYTHGEQTGYIKKMGATYYAIYGSGSVNIGEGISARYGDSSVTLEEVDDGIVFTGADIVEWSDFYVGEGTTVEAGNEGFTDIFDADTYHLAGNAVLDVKGNYFAGKTFVLGEGSTLKNSGNGLSGYNRMFQSIKLEGDATVSAESNMGIIAYNSADPIATSTLKLNGHTLTKTGEKVFIMTGTTIEGAGTIKIEEGTLQIGVEVDNHVDADTSATDVNFVLDGGSLFLNKIGNVLTARSLSGRGTVSGEGIVKLANTGTAESHTINGSVTLGGLEITGNDNYTFNGNLTIHNNDKSAYMLMHAGDFTLGKGTHSIDDLDISKGSNSASKLTLEDGANLTINDSLWLGDDAGINVKQGASLTRSEVKIEAREGAEKAAVSFHATSDDLYSSTNTNYTITDAKVSVNKGTENVEISNKLLSSELVNNGTGTLTATNEANNLSGINAAAGNINLQKVNLNIQQELLSLSIEEGMGVAAHVGTQEFDSADGRVKLTVASTGTATFANNSTLNADLEIKSGAKVIANGALDLNNSALTLGTNLTLSGTKLEEIKSLTSASQTMVLFTGVDTLTLGEQSFSMAENQVLTASDNVTLSRYFTAEDDTNLDNYFLGFNAAGDLYAGLVVPEPATATLSLLALAGLCARRRRKS